MPGNRKVVLSSESAQTLTHLREVAGLSQEGLAKLAGVSESVIRELEGGQRVHAQDMLQRVLDALRAEAKAKPAFAARIAKDQPQPRTKTATKKAPRINKAKQHRSKPIDWSKQPLGEVSSYELAQTLGTSIQVVERERSKRGLSRFDPENSHRRIQIDWEIVAPFFRKVPDDELAGKIGTTRQRVGQERKRRGIPAWDRTLPKVSLDSLVDGSWYIDERSLWERVDDVVKSLETLTTIRPIELLQRFKLSTKPANIDDAIRVLQIIGWKKQPHGQWDRPGIRSAQLSEDEQAGVDSHVLACLTLRGGMHTSLEVAAEVGLTHKQAKTSLQRLESEKKIKCFGQTRARRYLVI